MQYDIRQLEGGDLLSLTLSFKKANMLPLYLLAKRVGVVLSFPPLAISQMPKLQHKLLMRTLDVVQEIWWDIGPPQVVKPISHAAMVLTKGTLPLPAPLEQYSIGIKSAVNPRVRFLVRKILVSSPLTSTTTQTPKTLVMTTTNVVVPLMYLACGPLRAVKLITNAAKGSIWAKLPKHAHRGPSLTVT